MASRDARALFLAGDLAGAVAAAPPGSALAAVARGAWPEALAAATEPDDPLGLWCRATARLGLGDRPGALADWTTLIPSGPRPRPWAGRTGPSCGRCSATGRGRSPTWPRRRPGFRTTSCRTCGPGPSGADRASSGVRPRGRVGRRAGSASSSARSASTRSWPGVEAEALDDAARLRRRCQLHGYAGLLAERDGDPRSARAHYEGCVATGLDLPDPPVGPRAAPRPPVASSTSSPAWTSGRGRSGSSARKSCSVVKGFLRKAW